MHFSMRQCGNKASSNIRLFGQTGSVVVLMIYYRHLTCCLPAQRNLYYCMDPSSCSPLWSLGHKNGIKSFGVLRCATGYLARTTTKAPFNELLKNTTLPFKVRMQNGTRFLTIQLWFSAVQANALELLLLLYTRLKKS